MVRLYDIPLKVLLTSDGLDSEFLNTKLSDLPTTCAYASGFEPLSREGQLGFAVTTSAVNLENAVNFENSVFVLQCMFDFGN